jgi:hypothetical protein
MPTSESKSDLLWAREHPGQPIIGRGVEIVKMAVEQGTVSLYENDIGFFYHVADFALTDSWFA